MSQVNSAGKVTGYGLHDRGSISCRDNIFLSSTASRPALRPYPYDTTDFPRDDIGQNVKLTTHINPAQRS
jgi:hypothetical protein